MKFFSGLKKKNEPEQTPEQQVKAKARPASSGKVETVFWMNLPR